MKKEIKATTVSDWYDAESYPELDPERLRQAELINWDINMEDVEFWLGYDSPDLSDVAKVSYFADELEDLAYEAGYEGGYVVDYNDGSQGYFAWRPYPHNLDPLEELYLEEVRTLKFSKK